MTPASRLSSSPRQQGSTLTGFIIGLIVGLVCAVIVALVINKGATPFTDKTGKTGKAPEPTAGQISDPNKPLYGSKDAAREANKEFAKEPKPGDDAIGKLIGATPGMPSTAPAAGAPASAQPAAPAPAKPATPADAAKAPAKPAAPVPAPAAGADAAKAAAAAEDKFVYYLQTGAFRDLADAESARAKLALLGFEASVSDRTSDGAVLHRVRLGPYNQIEAMNKVRAKLSENGVDVAVVRNQK